MEWRLISAARPVADDLTSDKSFEMPLTQAELGDTLALSSVHVNRTLMELRRLKLVTIQSRHAVIHNLAGLCSRAGFDGGYLRIHPPFDALAAATA